MEFRKANMPVAVAAKALQMDCQIVRVLLQNGLVDWGAAYKRPGSRRYRQAFYGRGQMTEAERKELEELQDYFMKQYAEVESNPEDYDDFQNVLNDLDDKAEYVRGLLGRRWSG